MRLLIWSGLLLWATPFAAAQDRVPASLIDVALELARRDHPKLSDAKVRGEIDRLAKRYRALAAASGDPVDAFRVLLFAEQPFVAVKELGAAEHLHIDSVLRTRRGYCLSLSVVALAVAERVGAPLYGVAMPNHFLVRYDDGKKRRNLELTQRGKEISDAVLRKRLGDVPEGSIYLKNLGVRDVKAYLLHNRGYVTLLRKRRGLAQADFVAAIALQPGLGEAHRNLGVVFGEQKKWELAKRSFGKAIALHPGDINALINLAICRNSLGNRAAAIQELEMVLAMDPDRGRAQELLAQWRKQPRVAVGAEPLPKPPPGLKPGLRARYYAGMDFRVLKKERVDRDVDFDWQNAAPVKEAPRDRFSARWEGYFQAPRTGVYTFIVVANDGARLWIGDPKGGALLDNWKNMGFKNWYGMKDVRLTAGWHPIRIEHYDIFGGARMLLRIGVEGVEQPLDLKQHLFHTSAPKPTPPPAK